MKGYLKNIIIDGKDKEKEVSWSLCRRLVMSSIEWSSVVLIARSFLVVANEDRLFGVRHEQRTRSSVVSDIDPDLFDNDNHKTHHETKNKTIISN